LTDFNETWRECHVSGGHPTIVLCNFLLTYRSCELVIAKLAPLKVAS